MKKTSTKKGGKKLWPGTDMFVGNLPFIIVLAVCGLFLIFNSHRAEKKLLAIYRLKSEIKELEYEYSTLKKDLKSNTVLSKLEKDLEGELVFPAKGPILIGPEKS